MRLLILIHSLAGGGAERVTANLANYWSEKKGWDITIVTLASAQHDFYELSPSIRRISLQMEGGSANALTALIRNMHRVIAVRKVLRQIQPDIALGMMTTANILLALASWRLGRTGTAGSERTYPPRYPLGLFWGQLRRYCYGLLDAVVAQTGEGASWLQTHTSSRKTETIPNPVAWPLSNRQAGIEVNSICGTKRKILLAAGRLSEEKQFDLLIDCYRGLAERYENWDLVILGDGPLRTDLETQIHNAHLSSRVFLPGRAGNMAAWYERASLFVLCSRFEGFPNVLVEAMAYGLPVVSFDCDTGPRDIIESGKNGLLVPDSDKQGLAEALGRLMSDEELRNKLASQSLGVRERFSVEHIASRWERLFEEISR